MSHPKKESAERRSPQGVVNMLAYSLKEGKPGDEYRITDLVKMTSMNHVTITYYIDLIEHIQRNLPMIEYVEKKRNSYVRILKGVEMTLTEEEQLLLFLFDKGAFSRSTAVPYSESSRDVVKKLMDSLLLAETSEKAFLLTEGIVKAAMLADERADLVLLPLQQDE